MKIAQHLVKHLHMRDIHLHNKFHKFYSLKKNLEIEYKDTIGNWEISDIYNLQN